MSLAEADALVPRLTEIFARLAQLEAEIGARANELERLGANLGGGDAPSEDIAQRRRINHARAEEYRREVKKIGELGAILDDVELRIVDFPAELDGRPVHLCWQLGEREIRFYREPGAEFSRRRPLPGRER